MVRGDEALWPCLKHPFGTDRLGRDILVRCMIGTRISMIVGLVSAVIVMIVGSIYEAISGLVGGKVDIFYDAYRGYHLFRSEILLIVCHQNGHQRTCRISLTRCPPSMACRKSVPA